MANIPVNENDRLIIVTATVDGQVDFDFDFLAFTGDQVSATYVPASGGAQVALSFPADFGIAGLNNPNGGTISLNSLTTSVGDMVVIYGDTPIKRLADFQQSGDFLAETVNEEEDLQTMMMQEMQRDIDRAILVPLGETGLLIERGPEGTVLVVDADGNLVPGVTVAEIVAANGYAQDAKDAADRAELASSSLVADTFTGDGVTPTFTMSTLAQTKANVFPSIDGTVQHRDAFEVDGRELTFVSPPPKKSKIQALIFAVNVSDPGDIYPSRSALAASGELKDGRIYSAADAFNGGIEAFQLDTSSSLTPNNGTVWASASGGNLESLRTVYADWAEFNADPRDMTGAVLQFGPHRVKAVSTGEHYETTGGNKVLVQRGDDGTYNAATVGCDVSAPDNAAALTKLYSFADAVTFDEFYPVTGNFPRKAIPHHGVGGVVVGGVSIPLSTIAPLKEDVTAYVATTGSDTDNHGLSADYPFATEGMARKFLPPKLDTGVTYLVRVADGVYEDSAVAASEMDRPALLYLSGLSSDRSAVVSGNLRKGYIVQGDSKAGTIFRVGANSFTYGAYATQASNLGLQDLTIDTSAACAALATAHRASYLQTLNVDITGGANAAQCVVAESGGFAEITGDGDLTGSVNTVLAFDESAVVLSNTGSASGGSSSVLGGRGTISVNNAYSLSGTINAEGTRLVFRGSTAVSRVVCGLAGTIRNARIDATYADITGLLTCYGCDVDLNAVSHTERFIMKGGSINRRSGSTTGTPSAHDNPIALHYGAVSTDDGSCTYQGASGAAAPTRNPFTLNVTGNDQTLGIVDYTDHFKITGVSANRTGFQISSAGIAEGRVIYVDGDSWNVSFATGGAHMDISTAFGLGNSASFYSGATFQMRAGKWRCVGLGAPR